MAVTVTGVPYAVPSVTGAAYAVPSVTGAAYAVPSVTGAAYAVPSVTGAAYAVPTVVGAPFGVASVTASEFGESAAPVSNAVAWWPMNSDTVKIRDLTGRGNDLTRFMLPAVSDVAFTLGANDFGGQNLTGSLSKCGNWKRLLTPTEQAALRAGEGWPFATTPSLRDASVFYLLDEPTSSTTYADATGRGNTLTHVGGACFQVAGPLGTDKACRFGVGGVSYLVLYPPTPDVMNGNVFQTISCWAYLDALGVSQQWFWGQGNFVSRHFANVLYYFSSTDRLQSDFANNIDLYRNAVVVANSLGPPGAGVWHHMLFQYDPVTNIETLEIATLNGTASSDSLAEVQRPAARTSPDRCRFAVPPSFNDTSQSGWDNIGVQCFASHAANADLGFGPHSKSAWAWAKFDNTTTLQTVMGLLQSAGTVTDWVIQQSGGLLYFVLGDGAGGYDYTTVPLADANWHALICWYNTATGRIYIDLDNGAHAANAAVTHTPATGSLDFVMGACTQSTPTGRGQQLLADIGIAGVSNGVPTAADITALWAYGSGRFY